ncbi:MAG: hypothetical protein V3T49_02695 [Dehalococcoidia bacterium]
MELAEIAATGLQNRVVPQSDVWLIPNVDVYVDGSPTQTDPIVNNVQRLLDDMNELLYQATDGQIRISAFTIQSAFTLNPTAGGVVFHAHAPEHANTTSPSSGSWPGEAHANIGDVNTATVPNRARYVALMEFAHAYFGVRDEYEDNSTPRNRFRDPAMTIPFRCPDNNEVSCPMDGTRLTLGERNLSKFCGPSNWSMYDPDFSHDNSVPKNEQEDDKGMPCYEWIVQQLNAAAIAGKISFQTGRTLLVPSFPLSARPTLPAAAVWTNKLPLS